MPAVIDSVRILTLVLVLGVLELGPNQRYGGSLLWDQLRPREDTDQLNVELLRCVRSST